MCYLACRFWAGVVTAAWPRIVTASGDRQQTECDRLTVYTCSGGGPGIVTGLCHLDCHPPIAATRYSVWHSYSACVLYWWGRVPINILPVCASIIRLLLLLLLLLVVLVTVTCRKPGTWTRQSADCGSVWHQASCCRERGYLTPALLGRLAVCS